MDGHHGVTLDDSHSDRGTDRSIHTSTGSANVQDGHIDVTLSVREGEGEIFEEAIIGGEGVGVNIKNTPHY